MTDTGLTGRARRARQGIKAAVATARAIMVPAAEKLTVIVQRYLPEGAPLPNFLLIFETMIAILESCDERIRSWDKKLRKADTKKTRLGKSLEEIAKRAHSGYRQVRTDLVRVYGDAILAYLAIREVPGYARDVLFEQLDSFVEILREFVREEHTPRDGQQHVDADAKATFLEGIHSEFNTDQGKYENAIKELENIRHDYDRFLVDEVSVRIHAIGTIESLIRMAGYAEEANRLRILIRKEGQTSSDDTTDTPDDGVSNPPDPPADPPDPPADPPDPPADPPESP